MALPALDFDATCGWCRVSVRLPAAENEEEARDNLLAAGWQEEGGEWRCPKCKQQGGSN